MKLILTLFTILLVQYTFSITVQTLKSSPKKGKPDSHTTAYVEQVDLKSSNKAQEIIKTVFNQRELNGIPKVVIEVNLANPGQFMDGIGGAFCELGWDALTTLPKEKREQVVKNLFDSKLGACLSFNRIPIGSSDFAKNAYSLDETKDDWELKDFTIKRDKDYLIPYIKAAQAMNPAMKFHASPWSPPGWMKTNGSQTGGGELKSDDRTLRSHAGYLVKFLQAYAEQGIFINRLCPQNEPLVAGSYPGCKIPAPLYSKAVREWIIPAVKNAGLKTEIWAGTFNYWNPETHEHFESVLNDTELAHAIGGISFQYSHLPWVHQYHAKYPEVPIQFSESQCFGGNNTETEALRDFQDFASYTRAGSRLFTFWNIVLPEPRKSSWGWRQNSLVVIDKDKQTIMYEPDFALAQLLGRHIITGTRYLPSTIVKGDTLLGALHYPPTEGIGFMKSELENGEQVVAFAKPDGTIVLFVMNQGPSVMTEIRFGGKHVCVMLPEKRLSAIILK